MRRAQDGRELITGIYQTDDFLDLNIMLSQDTYDDTAVAMEDSVISYLPGTEFDKLLNLYPDIGTRFIKMLSNNIRERELRLFQIAYQSVRKRIAETLLRLITKHSADGKSITISRDDLAAMTGTAPETVSRTLTDFREEALIEKNGNQVTITDPDKIARLKN